MKLESKMRSKGAAARENDCLTVVPSANRPTACDVTQNEDPAFVDQYGDWRLKSGSGAIGGGLNFYGTPAADYDFEGNPRPLSPTAWDIGGYVFKPMP